MGMTAIFRWGSLGERVRAALARLQSCLFMELSGSGVLFPVIVTWDRTILPTRKEVLNTIR
jgi:hypothetical protein